MGCGASKQTPVEDGGSKKQTSPAKTSPTKAGQAKTSPAKGAATAGSPRKGADHNKPSDNARQKYMVNGSTHGASTNSDSAFSDPTDKGFKRRVREKLKEATAGTDVKELEKAIERFVQHKLEDCGDYSRAMDRLELLTLRRDLRDAIRRSHVGILEKTIKEAEASQYSSQLQNQIEAARRKLQHLKELNEYKHDILNMEQTTISEIHSYQRPPACVHDVMAATYMMLGHPEPKLTDWMDIQMLLCRVGRDSLFHEIRDFDSATVSPQTASRVRDILQQHELHDIRTASNGAATFYVWTTQICDKVDRDAAQEEDRLRSEEMQRQKNEERAANSTQNGTPPRKKQKG